LSYADGQLFHRGAKMRLDAAQILLSRLQIRRGGVFGKTTVQLGKIAKGGHGSPPLWPTLPQESA
jgi:hypothetical protein